MAAVNDGWLFESNACGLIVERNFNGSAVLGKASDVKANLLFSLRRHRPGQLRINLQR